MKFLTSTNLLMGLLLSSASTTGATIPDRNLAAKKKFKADLAANLKRLHNKEQVPNLSANKPKLRRTAAQTKQHNTVPNAQSINKRGQFQNRIIGGTLAKKTIPFYGLWEVGCGASLIHDDIMLSAAHCDIDDLFARRVYLGSLEANAGLVRNVVELIPHPGYDTFTNEYDFLILKLNTTALEDYYFSAGEQQEEVTAEDEGTYEVNQATSKQGGEDEMPEISPEITFSSTITLNSNETLMGPFPTGLQPISINRNASHPMEDQPLSVMGFGLTDPNGFGLVEDLYEVQVFFVDDEECDRAYGSLFTPANMFCAGHPRGGADSCQGDSGGPIVDPTNNVQVGVVSWGEGCGLKEYPGVYAQIDVVADWIEDEICKNSCYPPDTCDPAVRHPCADLVADNGGGPIVLQGPLAFTIAVEMDSYPSEFGAILTHADTGAELWYVGYNTFSDEDSPAGNPMVVEETFSNLPAGVYHLMLGDKSYDGLCCAYGTGNVLVTNSTGGELWSDNGKYGNFEEVYLNISETGQLVWAANNADGTIDDGWGEDDDSSGGDGGSLWWDDDDDDSAPDGTEVFDGSFIPSEDDEEWPGAFPSPVNSTNIIAINLRTDRFPEETTWEWSMRTGPAFWEAFDQGSPLRDNTVFSYEKEVESDTIYRLRISDSLSDGTCCLFGLGWFTITNATTSAEHKEGSVIWHRRGDELDGTLDAYIWVNENGMAQEVVYVPGQGYALVQYNFVSEERSIGDIVVADQRKSVDRHTPGGRR